MSPQLSPSARAAGQRVNDTAGVWKQWSCDLCGRVGREVGFKAARDAHLRHYMAWHQEAS